MPNWAFPVLSHVDLTAEVFERSYCAKGLAVLCRGVLGSFPWSSCLPYSDFTDLLTHPELSSTAVEISVSPPNSYQRAVNYKEDLSAEAAALLLNQRSLRDLAGVEDSIYVKVALSQCEGLMSELRLWEFMARSPAEPVDHPMLLRPGGYFCWAFIGERGSGSKTHVDVMGSDAWLVVLSGRKKWAMCHPCDKHLVMDENGTFADLFNIDEVKFPRAALARIAYFEQGVGDAIFVPSDAPHCVANEEFSVSVTFNFMQTSGEGVWRKNMQQLVSASNPIWTIDLIVRHQAAGRQFAARRFVPDLRAAPTDDLSCRCAITNIQRAYSDFEPHTRNELLAARPVGCDVTVADHRAVYYFDSADTTEVFTEWCERYSAMDGFLVETINTYEPKIRFSVAASHYGDFPTFPPLSVLLGWKWWFEDSIPLVSLVSQLREKSGRSDTVLGPMSTWHYSRYPWENCGCTVDGQAQWCRTQLFYCSPCIDGPVSLHPLQLDSTLQQNPSFLLQKRRAEMPSNFHPHFEEFTWSIDTLFNLGAPVGLYAFAGDLMRGLTTTFYMNEQFLFFEDFVSRHGLKYLSAEALLECGLEKIMAPALWFTSSPGVVGFAYSHTFSAVAEPNTVCLTAASASSFLTREVNSPAAAILSFLCNWITQQAEILEPKDLTEENLTKVVGQAPAEWLNALLHIVRVKEAADEALDGSNSEDAERARRCRAALAVIESRIKDLA
jgi:hypothetical protein